MKLTQNWTRQAWKGLAAAGILAAGIAACTINAATLVQFPFDEGSGTNFTDSVTGLEGAWLNVPTDENSTVELQEVSPSGQAGDQSVFFGGLGFLAAEDSTGALAFGQDQAFTIETWVHLDPNVETPNANEGLVTYGNAYKLGLRNGLLAFTLFGRVDMTSTFFVPADSLWHHVAVVYEPGVGATLYFDGFAENIPDTRLVPPYVNNSLVIGAERFGNSVAGNMDRVRIHQGALTPEQLDTDAATPKAAYENTVAAFTFNEAQLPVQSEAEAPLEAVPGSSLIIPWVEDDPEDEADDYAVRMNGSVRGTIPLVPEGLIAFPDGDYTLETWVKLPPVLPGYRMIMFQYEQAPSFSFSINTDGTLHTTSFGKSDVPSTAQVPQDGQWHHVAVVHKDGESMDFFVDGVLGATVPYTRGVGNTRPAGPVFTIGMASGGANIFLGQLDRIRISDAALTPAEMDTGIGAGHPFIVTQPTGFTVSAGEAGTLTAEVQGAQPLSLIWQVQPFGSDTVTTVENATGNTLAFSNITPEQQGAYTLVASNSFGALTSLVARVFVAADEEALTQVWALAPGDRPYLTPGNTGDSQTDNLERGMAYNPETGNILIVARETSPILKGVFAVDGETGAEAGQLDISGIGGGTFVLNKIAVADDGAIYAANFGSYPGTQFTVYRWEDEDAVPTIAFQGDPAAGAGNQQWGRNFAVRGSGTNTQILLDTRNQVVSLLTTENGTDFSANLLPFTNAPANAFGEGITFGEGDSFWGKNRTGDLIHMNFDLEAGTASLIQSYSLTELVGVDVDTEAGLLAGIFTSGDLPEAVHLFALGGSAPRLLDVEALPTDNANPNFSGNVAFGEENLLFVLDTNNGLVAYRVNAPDEPETPELSITQADDEVRISWPASASEFVLESSPVLGPNADWTPVSVQGGATEYVVDPSGNDEDRFFRLRR